MTRPPVLGGASNELVVFREADQGLLTQIAQAINDQHEVKKRQEHQVEFFEPGEDATEAFQAMEQAHDLIATG